MVDRVDP
jgi:hypothetical protein